MRRVGGLCIAMAVIACPLWSQQDQRPWRWARVTYLTTATAYVDAGRAEGVVDGSHLDVVRSGTVVAVLKVAFLATHQAAGTIESSSVTLAIGDSVRFVPAVSPPDSATHLAAEPATGRSPVPGSREAGSVQRRNPVRGRLGLSYLAVRQLDGSGARFTQPAGDFRLSAPALWGTGLGLAVDMRSRRVAELRADGLGTATRGQTRVYQAAFTWQPTGSPLLTTAGRQFAPGITPVGLVDGVSAQLDRRDWSGGVFVGSEPEPVNLGVSGAITDVGGYLRRRSSVDAPARWSFTSGLTGSYLHRGTNREFLYLQGDYSTRRLSVYAAQEVDYYRPWRRVGGEHAFSPTSSFATLQVRVTDAFALTAGVDNRRNVRLYRDVVNPEVTFDDAFRQGAWGGLSARVGRIHAALDARSSSGGPTGSAASYTLSLGADRLTSLGFSLRARETRYTGASRNGWLQAFALTEPWRRGSLQVAGGWRAERDRFAGATSIRWASADIDMTVVRGWFVTLSAYRERGGLESHDLIYAAAGLRF